MEPCRVHIVPALEFTQFVAEHGLTESLLRHTIGRLREIEQIRVELATADVSMRLAAALVRLASATEPNGEANIRLTQAELARLIGASRNAVGTTLAQWRAHGWVTTSAGGGLTVANVPALDRLTTGV
jgi:CRP-like cAMP-binding protein